MSTERTRHQGMVRICIGDACFLNVFVNLDCLMDLDCLQSVLYERSLQQKLKQKQEEVWRGPCGGSYLLHAWCCGQLCTNFSHGIYFHTCIMVLSCVQADFLCLSSSLKTRSGVTSIYAHMGALQTCASLVMNASQKTRCKFKLCNFESCDNGLCILRLYSMRSNRSCARRLRRW